MPTGSPPSHTGDRKRRYYDEAAEAAAMYRRVDRELLAEHMAQVAHDKAAAEAVAADVGRAVPQRFTTGASHRRIPTWEMADTHRPRGTTAPGTKDRAARGTGRDGELDSLHDRPLAGSQGIQPSDNDVVEPADGSVPTATNALLNLAIGMAQELARTHKRSRQRTAILAEAVGIEADAFEGLVAGAEYKDFASRLLKKDLNCLCGREQPWIKQKTKPGQTAAEMSFSAAC